MIPRHRYRRLLSDRAGYSPVVLFLALAALWLVLVAGVIVGFSPAA